MKTNAKLTLTEKVKRFKAIAENAIRMRMLLPYLSNIEYVKKTIALQTKNKAADQHIIDSAIYDLAKLDTKHPDYVNMKAQAKSNLELLKIDILQYDEEFVELAAALKEEEDGATNIENGQTHVSASDLETLVCELIKKDAHNQV
jgi:hypothetical protein